MQQDMMRPKSAFFYIDEITEISNDLLNLLDTKQDENGTVEDVTAFTYSWSLESIGAIFLDTRSSLFYI